MGKHDKKVEPVTVFTWQPMPDEFYKARISTLEKENAKLRAELLNKERSIGGYELAIDHQDEIHEGVVGEYQELLAEKDGEIDALKLEIKMLKEAVVKGALREVLA